VPILDIDDRLLKKALRVGRQPSKEAAVTEALQEYIARREQARVTELFGTINYNAAYDYKKQRKRK
jgi:hypothetical protein